MKLNPFNRLQFFLLALAVAVLAAGCGGGDSADSGKSDSGSSSSDSGSAKKSDDKKGKRSAFPTAKATASITGKVNYGGDAKRTKIRIQGDEFCQTAHADNPALSETIIKNGNGTLMNVIVSVKKGADDWTFETPKDPVVLDQKGCVYTPHVVTLMADQPLAVKSSDATTHNVHFLGKANREFNLTQKQGQEDVKNLKREEIAKVKCDIHSWMSAHIGIFYHPFHDVTGDDGSFDLGKLPAGKYEIEAWHEELGTKTQSVTLADGESKSIVFSF